MKQVTVTVSGPTAAGKSGVATLLADMLRDLGVKVEHDTGSDGPISGPPAARVAANGAAGLVVTIREVNTLRGSAD